MNKEEHTSDSELSNSLFRSSSRICLHFFAIKVQTILSKITNTNATPNIAAGMIYWQSQMKYKRQTTCDTKMVNIDTITFFGVNCVTTCDFEVDRKCVSHSYAMPPP
jgi:hypothetical protein